VVRSGPRESFLISPTILEPLNQSYLTVTCICLLDNAMYLHMREHTPYTLMNNVYDIFLIKHSYFIAKDSLLFFLSEWPLNCILNTLDYQKEFYLAAYQITCSISLTESTIQFRLRLLIHVLSIIFLSINYFCQCTD